SRNLGGALLALDPERDRNLADPEILADQRYESGHRTPGRSAEDGGQRLGLFVVRALIDVGCRGPVSVGHHARRMQNNERVESIECPISIADIFDVENKGHVAESLGRSRSQRSGCRYQARAQEAATAILEVVAGKMPGNLIRHCLLPLRWNPMDCVRMSRVPV